MIYIPGGGCGYRQSLNFIKLRKIDEMTGDTLKFLYICRFNGGTCDSNEKTSVTLSRGHLGNDFVLTLSNLTADSIGAYEVIVDRSSPDSGSTQPLSKKFRLVGK